MIDAAQCYKFRGDRVVSTARDETKESINVEKLIEKKRKSPPSIPSPVKQQGNATE